MTSAAALAGISGNELPVRVAAFTALLVYASGLILAGIGLFFNAKQVASMASGIQSRYGEFTRGEAGHSWVTEGPPPKSADIWGSAFSLAGWGSLALFVIATTYLGYALRNFWF